MFDHLIPRFARLDDWFGTWAFEERSFAGLWDFLQRQDLTAHAHQFRAQGQGAPPSGTLRLIDGKGGKRVAVVSLLGTLMKAQSSYGGTSTVQARRDIRAAAADPSVSAILLAIDSPGGTVAGTADLAADVKAARKRKPVWAHFDDLGASAAYWVASQAGAVFANDATALVGSIGTMQVVVDSSGKAEKDGIKVHVFRTGPLKGAGAPGAPVTDGQVSHMQALVEKTQESFTAAVRGGRRLSDAKLAKVLTGGVWLAPEAQGLGLIDGVRSLDETLGELLRAG